MGIYFQNGQICLRGIGMHRNYLKQELEYVEFIDRIMGFFVCMKLEHIEFIDGMGLFVHMELEHKGSN